jgi:putative FmdB family regulatory protein
MPTYEYSCQKCGHTFETVQSMSADALTTCPREVCPQKKWGKGKVKRGVGGGAGLIFKGSGFYITDYRSEGYKSAAKQDSGSGSSSSSGAAASSVSGSGATTPSPSTSAPSPAPAASAAPASSAGGKASSSAGSAKSGGSRKK